MLNADNVPYFETCPRCGVGGYERLNSYSHCISCLHFEDHDWSTERSAAEVQRLEQELDELKQNQKNHDEQNAEADADYREGA